MILDNRKSKFYSRGHIPHSVNLPFAKVLENEGYKKDEELEEVLDGLLND
jgi:3-mercaptopyruvate sulfurtransferase SseA